MAHRPRDCPLTHFKSTLVEVTAQTTGSEYYFPELFLSHWFHQRGEAVLKMTLLWCFRLDAVIQRLLYSPELFETQTRHDLGRVIAEYREQHPARRWAELPM